MDDRVYEDQIDRLVGAIRAQGFALQVVTASLLAKDGDSGAGARALCAAMGDKFADALPAGPLAAEREARVNHYSAHFAERFWTQVEEMLVARNKD